MKGAVEWLANIVAAMHYMTGTWLLWSTIHLHLEEAKAQIRLQHEEELFLYHVIQS